MICLKIASFDDMPDFASFNVIPVIWINIQAKSAVVVVNKRKKAVLFTVPSIVIVFELLDTGFSLAKEIKISSERVGFEVLIVLSPKMS